MELPRKCSRGSKTRVLEEGLAAEGTADGIEGGRALLAGRADHRADVAIKVGAPERSEAG